MHRAIGVALATGIILAGCTSSASTGSSPSSGGSPSPDVFTPLVLTSFTPARPVLGTDDKLHIAWTVLATNNYIQVATLTKVEIVDAAHEDSTIRSFEGKDLAAVISPIGEPASDLPPGVSVRLLMDAAFDKNTTLPTAVEERISMTLTPKGGAPMPMTEVAGRIDVRKESAVVVGPPLRGGRWLDFNGCCFPPSTHRMTRAPANNGFWAPEQFGIDFLRLTSDGRLFVGPVGENSSYAYLGSDILSVADGTVVSELDGQPEQVPGALPSGLTIATAGGNNMIVDIGGGRFALYAHMEPGSLVPKVGDRVKKGQVIGKLGNTGNSSAAHLHFQIMDRPSALGANGLPFVFESITGEGTLTNPEKLIDLGGPAVKTPLPSGDHRNQMPLLYAVMGFPE